MTITAYLLNAQKGHVWSKYVLAPKDIVERYIANHSLYEGMRGKDIPAFEVEVIGNLGGGGVHGGNRILITGDFPYYEKRRSWAIADDRLAPVSEPYGWQSPETYPLLGEGRHIINAILGADGGTTEIPIEELAKVSTYTEAKETEFTEIGHSPYAQRSIDRLNLTMTDSSSRIAYVHSVGYFEGYQYDLFASKKAAYGDAYATLKARAKQGWINTECWECGAVYEEPGHVEPGQMGCDRCNS